MNEVVGDIPVAEPELAQFIRSLVTDGRAIVSAQPLDLANVTALPLLQAVDEGARTEAGIEAPAFSESAALWGAQMLYQLCQFIVCRNIGEPYIEAACAIPCPAPRGPETDWSVDLMFRHLPKVFQLARHLSNGDPLLQHLKRFGREWPLSSVGMPDLNDLQLDSFIGHPGLARIYADRIVDLNDTARLGDPRVEVLLRADLGIHHHLSAGLAAKLFNVTT
jgi:hypothetical protein